MWSVEEADPDSTPPSQLLLPLADILCLEELALGLGPFNELHARLRRDFISGGVASLMSALSRTKLHTLRIRSMDLSEAWRRAMGTRTLLLSNSPQSCSLSHTVQTWPCSGLIHDVLSPKAIWKPSLMFFRCNQSSHWGWTYKIRTG